MSLPWDKCIELKGCLTSMMDKAKATKKQLSSLAGKLSWASLCIYGGRQFLRGIFNRINSLTLQHHRARITGEVRADIRWWLSYMDQFNNTVPMVDLRPATPVSIDSCQLAGGAFYLNDAVYTPWGGTDAFTLPINYKEVIALEPAVQAWAACWTNKRIYVHSDNLAAVSIINRGSCKNPIVMASLQRVFWLSAQFNFRIRAVFYPGYRNTLADCVSRLHEPGAYQRLVAEMGKINNT